jgi:hypothetical protein
MASRAKSWTAMRSLSVSASDVYWLDPARIQCKISPIHDLHGIQSGNWDINRRHELADAVKHRSIRQRYVDGVAWEETDLFKMNYAQRLARGESVRGEISLRGLAQQYYDRMDAMFRSLERDGFLLHNRRGRPLPLPGLYIGRVGEVFIGNQGNHRLAMAQIIGLDAFAGKIVCKHSMA